MKKFVRSSSLSKLEEFEHEFVEISKIKKGDVFYECNTKWGNIQMTAISDPRFERGGWTCDVLDVKGRKFDVFVASKTRYYGADFYTRPQIIDQNEKGEYGYYID